MDVTGLVVKAVTTLVQNKCMQNNRNLEVEHIHCCCHDVLGRFSENRRRRNWCKTFSTDSGNRGAGDGRNRSRDLLGRSSVRGGDDVGDWASGNSSVDTRILSVFG